MKCKNCGNDPLDAFLGDVCDTCRRAEMWREAFEAVERENRRALIRRVVVVATAAAAAAATLLWWLL